ncbi:glucose 1-dehydrogenase [Rhizobium sp. BK251]|uniref:SDR family NAD(P)-dependent oxidoreductase n=1 Tax=Rhizobium sp. BK251 TaxID=2512125 RepID=UPI001049CDF8|nr:glucose 1-dehydrogenase [Rhizobium sp. BK251]TCL69640.1 NAD(P)-dependent dehydrogenase (short-subunit alcohol dehydrogenase family) [Rhizobium sp. BK251]
MSKKLEGKVAVVTGGTTGIGLGIARQFAKEGATVFITGRRAAELEAAVKEIGSNAIGVQSDVSNLADLDRLYDEVQQRASHIDILAANAGGGSFAPLGSITEEDFDKTFAINVKGMLFTVQKALPLLRDGASIILTSSTATTRAIPAFSVYGASKAAIRNFARHWILDLKDRGIRVNAISPGPTLTPGLKGLTSNEAEWTQFEGYVSSQVPLGRLGDPNEIGRAAVFLASEDASFVNGVELFVDGGTAQI